MEMILGGNLTTAEVLRLLNVINGDVQQELLSSLWGKMKVSSLWGKMKEMYTLVEQHPPRY